MNLDEIQYILDSVNNKFSVKFTDDKIAVENDYEDITVLFNEDNKIIGIDINNLSDHINNLAENVGKKVIKNLSQKLIK